MDSNIEVEGDVVKINQPITKVNYKTQGKNMHKKRITVGAYVNETLEERDERLHQNYERRKDAFKNERFHSWKIYKRRNVSVNVMDKVKDKVIAEIPPAEKIVGSIMDKL